MADKYVKLDDIIETLEHEWGYEGMREDLYNLHTADVEEVKYGEWLATYYPDIYQCSVCRKEVNDHYINLHKHCLHCGAKMDGGNAE